MRKSEQPAAPDGRAMQERRRKGVRRTVAILVVIALVFYVILFAQIIIAKMQ